MDHRARMRQYLDLVEDTTLRIREISQVIQAEVQRRYGHRIGNADSPQERANLTMYYRARVTKENQWHDDAIGDRALYISLATMHGIAALVEKDDVS